MSSWSELAGHRRAIGKRWRNVYALPLVRSAKRKTVEGLPRGASVLEIGAGDGKLGRMIESADPDATYRAMDIDPHVECDFHSLEEIDETFDAVVAIDVIEHLVIDDIPAWLDQLAARCKIGGHLMLSTPNTFCPAAYLRDATHRTPIAYDELGGMVTAAGAEVESMYRVDGDAWMRRITNRFLLGWLFRTMRLDHAQRIFVVATRLATDNSAV